jgi:hypothetical protein
MIDKAELFDEDERYSPAANDLDREINEAVASIMARYIESGYSIRDVEYIAMGAVREVALSALLNWE